MTKPVEIVRVSRIIPIFKSGEPANSIEVINFNFQNGDECGFNVVSQKGIYQVGDEAVYIQPDYCLPDTELFKSFTAPNGDPNKSKLGKQNRIKAIKFDFQFENSSDPIYSNGILLPLSEVGLPDNRDDSFDIAEFLGITKYEEPEKFRIGNAKGNLPGFLYKTDEENAANLKSHINRVLAAGERIGCTLKIDGSSFTQYFKKDETGWTTGICSRVMEKKVPEDLSLTSDAWISLAVSSGLFERGMKYCQDNNRELAFRGEIHGENLKGSGNKLNPHSKMKPGLAIFGIDDLSSGFATKLLPEEVAMICSEIDVPYVETIEIMVKDYDELVEIANSKFKAYQEERGWVVEGVVVRTLDNNKLSCKVMNNAYDTKK
jgi:RNA ligase (TIGR02306 family)